MTTMSQTTSHAMERATELRSMVDELVYARALIAIHGDALREDDPPLRQALRAVLDELADREAERQRIANAALEAAWARIASELAREPEQRGPLASAA